MPTFKSKKSGGVYKTDQGLPNPNSLMAGDTLADLEPLGTFNPYETDYSTKNVANQVGEAMMIGGPPALAFQLPGNLLSRGMGTKLAQKGSDILRALSGRAPSMVNNPGAAGFVLPETAFNTISPVAEKALQLAGSGGRAIASLTQNPTVAAGLPLAGLATLASVINNSEGVSEDSKRAVAAQNPQQVVPGSDVPVMPALPAAVGDSSGAGSLPPQAAPGPGPGAEAQPAVSGQDAGVLPMLVEAIMSQQGATGGQFRDTGPQFEMLANLLNQPPPSQVAAQIAPKDGFEKFGRRMQDIGAGFTGGTPAYQRTNQNRLASEATAEGINNSRNQFDPQQKVLLDMITQSIGSAQGAQDQTQGNLIIQEEAQQRALMNAIVQAMLSQQSQQGTQQFTAGENAKDRATRLEIADKSNPFYMLMNNPEILQQLLGGAGNTPRLNRPTP